MGIKVSLVQMQISLAALKRSGVFPESEKRFDLLLQRFAAVAEQNLQICLRDAEKSPPDWYAFNQDWRELPVRSILNMPPEMYGVNPVFPADFQRCSSCLRAFGNYASTILFSSGYQASAEIWLRLMDVLLPIDFSHVNTGGIIPLYHACSILLDRKMMKSTERNVYVYGKP